MYAYVKKVKIFSKRSKEKKRDRNKNGGKKEEEKGKGLLNVFSTKTKCFLNKN